MAPTRSRKMADLWTALHGALQTPELRGKWLGWFQSHSWSICPSSAHWGLRVIWIPPATQFEHCPSIKSLQGKWKNAAEECDICPADVGEPLLLLPDRAMRNDPAARGMTEILKTFISEDEIQACEIKLDISWETPHTFLGFAVFASVPDLVKL